MGEGVSELGWGSVFGRGKATLSDDKRIVVKCKRRKKKISRGRCVANGRPRACDTHFAGSISTIMNIFNEPDISNTNSIASPQCNTYPRQSRLLATNHFNKMQRSLTIGEYINTCSAKFNSISNIFEIVSLCRNPQFQESEDQMDIHKFLQIKDTFI